MDEIFSFLNNEQNFNPNLFMEDSNLKTIVCHHPAPQHEIFCMQDERAPRTPFAHVFAESHSLTQAIIQKLPVANFFPPPEWTSEYIYLSILNHQTQQAEITARLKPPTPNK